MANSQTEICNLALARLGEDRILDLSTPNDKNARFCSIFYSQSLRQILRAGSWHFASDRTTLTRDVETPPFRWTYQYFLPADYVYVLDFNGIEPHQSEPLKYVVEKSRILSDDTAARLRYIFYNDEPGTYPADFVEALAVLLASKLAQPLTGSRELGMTLKAEYKMELLPTALKACAQESRPDRPNRILESDLVKARRARPFF